MYGRFVGLDIGSDTIKATLVKRGIRDTKLLQTIQVKSPDSPRATSELLKEVFTENSLPKSDIATSLPNNPISIRVFNFPFSDPNKIDKVYRFELENISPFDYFVDKVHGYHVIKRGEGSEAVVCMFQKEDVEQLLDVYQAGGIDPKIITFAPLAFSTLNGFLLEERPIVLINVGASEMSFSLFDGEGIRRVRSSSKAGKLITETISRTLGISHDVAESRKREGFSSGRNQVVEEAMAPVLGEIKRTVQFFELELKEEVKTILLSGGTSLMPGICDYLRRELKKDVERLFIPDLGEDNSSIFAESFALALYGSVLSRGSLNLRKGEFKYTGKDGDLRKIFMIPALLLALLIFFSIYRAGARYFELREEVKKIEAETQRVVREMFPNVKVIPKPVAFMESEVGKVREKLKLIEGIRGGPTPLDVLRDISKGIPSSVELTVDEINFVDDKTVKMRGRCGSYDGVARIEKALSDSGLFEQVLRDSTDTAVNNTIKFQITLVLK